MKQRFKTYSKRRRLRFHLHSLLQRPDSIATMIPIRGKFVCIFVLVAYMFKCVTLELVIYLMDLERCVNFGMPMDSIFNLC